MYIIYNMLCNIYIYICNVIVCCFCGGARIRATGAPGDSSNNDGTTNSNKVMSLYV